MDDSIIRSQADGVLTANAEGRFLTPSDVTDYVLDMLTERVKQWRTEAGLPVDNDAMFVAVLAAFDVMFPLFMDNIRAVRPELADWIEEGLREEFEHPAEFEDPALYA